MTGNEDNKTSRKSTNTPNVLTPATTANPPQTGPSLVRILMVEYHYKDHKVREVLGIFDNDEDLERQKKLAKRGLEEEDAEDIEFEVIVKKINDLTYT